MTDNVPLSPALPFEVAVVGGGPAGLAAALAFAHRGIRTALILKSGPVAADLRTAALFPGSVRLLENLGVWQDCLAGVEPLKAIRILDDTSWLLKAPETVFDAAELGEPALAWNVTQTDLVRALGAAVAANPLLVTFHTAATPAYTLGADAVSITLAEGTRIGARLVAAADGRASPLRDFAGIGTRHRKLEQTALVTTFAHSRPHNDVSTEIHRDAGPLTTVPMPGNRSSLVWVERPREAERLLALTDAEFLAELQRRLLGLLGTLRDLTPRLNYRLQWLEVDAFARNRVALIGEAAHVLPPIGAQGLNLGLRDVADLAEIALTPGDPGAPDRLAAYDRGRRAYTVSRSVTVDILNQSLEAGTLPLQLARGAGLFAMRFSPFLKRAVMRHGAGGLGTPPSLMRAPDILPPQAGHRTL